MRFALLFDQCNTYIIIKVIKVNNNSSIFLNSKWCNITFLNDLNLHFLSVIESHMVDLIYLVIFSVIVSVVIGLWLKRGPHVTDEQAAKLRESQHIFGDLGEQIG